MSNHDIDKLFQDSFDSQREKVGLSEWNSFLQYKDEQEEANKPKLMLWKLLTASLLLIPTIIFLVNGSFNKEINELIVTNSLTAKIEEIVSNDSKEKIKEKNLDLVENNSKNIESIEVKELADPNTKKSSNNFTRKIEILKPKNNIQKSSTVNLDRNEINKTTSNKFAKAKLNTDISSPKKTTENLDSNSKPSASSYSREVQMSETKMIPNLIVLPTTNQEHEVNQVPELDTQVKTGLPIETESNTDLLKENQADQKQITPSVAISSNEKQQIDEISSTETEQQNSDLSATSTADKKESVSVIEVKKEKKVIAGLFISTELYPYESRTKNKLVSYTFGLDVERAINENWSWTAAASYTLRGGSYNLSEQENYISYAYAKEQINYGLVPEYLSLGGLTLKLNRKMKNGEIIGGISGDYLISVLGRLYQDNNVNGFGSTENILATQSVTSLGIINKDGFNNFQWSALLGYKAAIGKRFSLAFQLNYLLQEIAERNEFDENILFEDNPLLGEIQLHYKF